MEPERCQLIERLFHPALEREESQRAGYLEGACRGDEPLHHEIEHLLARETKAKDFLEVPALEREANTLPQDRVQSKVGRVLPFAVFWPGGRLPIALLIHRFDVDKLST